MSRQTDEKQILKFYIRLLLYIDDIHNKYRNIESAKSSSDSDDQGSGYLKFLRRERKSDLIEQLKDNLKYNKEDPHGVSIDYTFIRLFKQKKQEPASEASEASEVKPELAQVVAESAQKLAQTAAAAAVPLAAAAETAVSDTGVAETLAGLGELAEQ